MNHLGHQLLKKHFSRHGHLISKLWQVCHVSPPLLKMSDELYLDLCRKIVERSDCDLTNFWHSFDVALHYESKNGSNYEHGAIAISDFFPKMRLNHQWKASAEDFSWRRIFADLFHFVSE